MLEYKRLNTQQKILIVTYYCDMSAIEAVNKITARYAAEGKTVHLRHLSSDCRRLLDRADAIIEVNHFEDPTYKVVTDATK